MKKPLLTAVVVSTILGGCTSSFDISQEVVNKDISKTDVQLQQRRGTTYVREVTVEEGLSQIRVTRTAKKIALIDALAEALPGFEFIPTSPDVDLSKKIDIRAANMRAVDFIEYLESASGYEMGIQGNSIRISSFTRKEWNLSAFATSRNVNNKTFTRQSGSISGDDESGGGGTTNSSYTSIDVSITEDEWLNLIEGARNIVGVEDDDDDDDDDDYSRTRMPGSISGDTGIAADLPMYEKKWERFTPYVHGIRSSGIVTAAGPAYKMAALDTYLKKSIDVAHTVFNVDIKAYDVILTNSKQRGIDWGALSSGSISGNPFDLTFTKAFNNIRPTELNTAGATIAPVGYSDGVSIGTGYAGDRGGIAGLVNFLETYGEVEISEQPNITVRNGAPAMVTAGTEFSFIADFEQTQDSQGNSTVTPVFDRIRVGVSLAVTARRLEDNKILLDLWPVISDITGEDTFNVDTGSTNIAFSTPRTALRELSTQVIVTSGESIHLGGLITKRMNKALTGLPISNGKIKGLLDVAAGNVTNELERRELVLVVTPSIVEGRF